MKIRIKLSRIIGLLVLTTVYYMIVSLFSETDKDEIKLRCIDEGIKLGMAFLGAVASKNLKNLVTINRRGNNDE